MFLVLLIVLSVYIVEWNYSSVFHHFVGLARKGLSFFCIDFIKKRGMEYRINYILPFDISKYLFKVNKRDWNIGLSSVVFFIDFGLYSLSTTPGKY